MLRTLLGLAAAIVVIGAAACGHTSPSAPSPPATAINVLIGAGDIADCGPGTRQTAALIAATPGVVFTAGDNAYPNGSAEDFARCYEPTWGAFKNRTRPAPGNHDYGTAGAAAYFQYFGSNAGPDNRGYYSYEIGSWHVISLNSNVPAGAGSPQEQWLRSDLESHAAACTVAYWHHPLFSSGPHGNSTSMRDIWRALYAAGADIVINGHDHDYERFALQDPDGHADPVHGIREFVVGTGGAERYSRETTARNSEVWNGTSWGVLKLTLSSGSYSWEFLPASVGGSHDSGSGTCVAQ